MDLAASIAFIGCSFLVIYLLIVLRKLFGFLMMVCGWALIIAMVRSDRQPAHLVGIFIAGAFFTALVCALYGMVKARRRTYRVYKPSRHQVQRLAERREV